MIRRVAGVAAGLVMWILVATAGNLVLRGSWPSYAGAESPMTFTLAMLTARLLLGAASSVCAGFLTAWITRSDRIAPTALGIVLIALFIPVHYDLWDKFPLWYHLTFLGLLLPLTLLGASLKP